MHALSLPTWWIHITSVLEWVVAIVAVREFARVSQQARWRWLAVAMVPALVSAMAACTWHLYDNSPALAPLVIIQAGLTLLGNTALAGASLWILEGLRAPSAQEP
jgi:polyferredoxin